MKSEGIHWISKGGHDTKSSTNIMVVDDNQGLTKTMSLILKKQGFTVLIAHNGLDAIHQIEEGVKVDIIFMDIKMPELNGVETYKRLKRIVPNATVIMMTAYAVENLVQEALEEGAYSIIYKPFDFDYLLSLIGKIRETHASELILIVDESVHFIEEFMNTLSQRRYKVHMATSCPDAFEKISVNEYDIIFIDNKLIQEEGFETFTKIKGVHPKIPIIIISADDAAPKEIEKILLQGGHACLRKPIDTKQLLVLLEGVLPINKEGK
ncbi:MAG: response regulator [Candidatus Thorarchaeota archaeon]